MRIALTLGKKASRSKTSDYERALLKAGFHREEIVRVEPGSVPAEGFDGVVLGGGCDVDPTRYGEKHRSDANLQLEADRDVTDFAVFEQAWREKTPVLAICRGLQVANVALGGTLIQDLPSQRLSGIVHSRPEETSTARREHAVRIAPGTRLHAIAGTEEISVNSRHHQAIETPAGSLRIAATAPDGVVEAAEAGPERWLLAVQWHPENLVGDPVSERLFAEFARVVREGHRVIGRSGDRAI